MKNAAYAILTFLLLAVAYALAMISDGKVGN